jgi:hypothetical protein
VELPIPSVKTTGYGGSTTLVAREKEPGDADGTTTLEKESELRVKRVTCTSLLWSANGLEWWA